MKFKKFSYRKWLRTLIGSIMHYTGLNLLCLMLTPKPVIRILMYHSISDDPTDLHSVSPAAFEHQMKFLAKNCNVVSLEQVIDQLDEAGSLPPSVVAITFDDGFANHYTLAYPILKKYGLPATMFIVPDWIVNATQAIDSQFMNWDQVRALSQAGITIGSHTMSHRCLTKLSTKEIYHELAESKMLLEMQLGQEIKLLSYPYGSRHDFNQEIMGIAAQCGYLGAVTSRPGWNHRGVNICALRRTEVEITDDLFIFDKIVKGALDNQIIRSIWKSIYYPQVEIVL